MKKLGLYLLFVLVVSLTVLGYVRFFTFPYELEAKFLFLRKADAYNAFVDELHKHEDIREVFVVNESVFVEYFTSSVQHKISGEVADRFKRLFKIADMPINRKVDGGIMLFIFKTNKFDRTFDLGFVRRQPGSERDECAFKLLEAEAGNCDIKLNERWVINYDWTPILQSSVDDHRRAD